MEAIETPIKDLIVIRRSINYDERGSVTRIFGKSELAELGKPMEIASLIYSSSTVAGTLRGIHFQYEPYAEQKLISCTKGSIWDVGVDLRENSPTIYQWFGVELTPSNGLSLLVPEGFGHGFITLEPESTALYAISSPYSAEHEAGLRFDDPAIRIEWPREVSKITKRDLSWPSITCKN